MCGICGIVRLDGSPVDDGPLAQMNAAIVHRGPDSEGALVQGPVAFAMRRLSIIDLAGGDQPIGNEDGSIQVVQNGEIYNHRELRAELEAQGHRFATHSDTEVLVHLYEQHGLDFVKRLRGMFAFALWDSREERVVIGRDPFGIKPLYYTERNGQLLFGSELKSLPVGAVDPDALNAFLAFNSIPAPRTIYAGTHKLPPGHLLVWQRRGEPRVERYMLRAPAARGELRRESEATLATELRDRLRDSVRAHLESDVPVGVLLSGGVDSGALTALAAQESRERVRTFSIGFEDQAFDEVERARMVAKRYDTDHHELVLEPDAVDLLPRLVAAYDEPFADSSALPTYLVMQLASEHVKVVLSGEGGDELFGGYFTYVADLLAPWARPTAPVLRAIAARMRSSSKRVSFDYKLRRFAGGLHLPPLERHHAWKEIFSPAERSRLLARELHTGVDPLDVYRERYALTEGAPQLARLQDVDIAIYLADDLLVKTDRASMAHSVEARVPFLDPVVADFALSLPTSAKVRGFSKKRLLREAVAPLLPREITHGPKRGFSIPAAAWLRGELQPFAREVLSTDNLRNQGYFDAREVHRLLDEHVARTRDHSRQLWGLLSFTRWHELHASRSELVPA